MSELGVSETSGKGKSQGLLVESVLLIYSVSAVQLLLSLAANFVLPRFATKLAFADYRVLVLYAGYAGFVHAGLLNGFYLKVIGQHLSDLDIQLILITRRSLLALEALVLPIAFLLLVMVLPRTLDRRIILVAVVSWAFANQVTLFNYLFQATGHFRTYAWVNLICSLLGLGLLVYFVLVGQAIARNLVIAFMVPLVGTTLLYEILWQCRIKQQLVFHDSNPVGRFRETVSALWRQGFALYSANVCMSLLFTLAILLASIFLSQTAFADFAFAYGLTSITYIAFDGLTSAVVPHLARGRGTSSRQMAVELSSAALILLSPLVFWVARIVVQIWVPHYEASLPLVAVFAAFLPFTAVIRSHVVATSIAESREASLLRVFLTGLLIAVILTPAAFLLTRSPLWLAAGWGISIALTATTALLFASRVGPSYSRTSLRRLLVSAGMAAAVSSILILKFSFGISLILYVAVAIIAFGGLVFVLRRRSQDQVGSI